jgi:hypothetical protein
MKEEYIAPKLTLVGETSEVVLGSLRVGIDFDSQILSGGMEFEADDSPTIESR